MLNKIIVMGRLTHDPELRRTGSGTPVCSFSIACDRDFKSQSGEKETDFFDVVAWRANGEFVSKYFTKGRMVVVEGRLQVREWQDKEGNKRRSAEVIADNVYFGDSRPGGAARRSTPIMSTLAIPVRRRPRELPGLVRQMPLRISRHWMISRPPQAVLTKSCRSDSVW